MSLLFVEDRNMSPNWRSPQDTVLNGEMENCRIVNISTTTPSIQEYIDNWKTNKEIPYAGELLSAAVTNAQTHNAEVKNAAEFIVQSHKLDNNNPLIELAKSILYVPDNIHKQEVKATIDPEAKRNQLRQEIAQGRLLVKQYPYSAYRHLELARRYMSSGLWEKAQHEISIALHLAPNDRYVTRSAVRCALHIGNNDRARDILTRNKALRVDPWLMATDIIVDIIRGKSPRSYKRGKQLIEDRRFTPRSITELAMSLAMLEYHANGRKKLIRSLVDLSLKDPIDNSLAQAQWLSRKNAGFELTGIQEVKFDYEVETNYMIAAQDWTKAYEKSLLWVEDSAFSRKAITTASNISTIFLDNIEDGIQLLEIGLIANPNAAMLLNNLAYHQLKLGRIEDGRKNLSKIDGTESITDDTRICIMATQGLLSYRIGDTANGKDKYETAIKECQRQHKPLLETVAQINYYREQAFSREISPEKALELINNLPNTNPSIARQKINTIQIINDHSKNV